MAFHFRTLDSELLVDAPILALRRDTVEMPTGNHAVREVVEHFGAVAVVAFDGEKIALIRQFRQSASRHMVELPAGILDMAGEEALSCARRELKEEAGLAAESWSLLVDMLTSPGFCDEAVRIYLAQGLNAVERPVGVDEEADLSLEWVELDEAVAMVMRGEVNNSIAIAGILSAYQVLRGGAPARSTDTPYDLRPRALAGRRQAQGCEGDMKVLRG